VGSAQIWPHALDNNRPSCLVRWDVHKMDAVAESGRNPVSKHQIDDSARVWRMSGLTRDGTAEPVSRGQVLRLPARTASSSPRRERRGIKSTPISSR
ncbi:unnamed protein product, partial [Ascophyllum nodosum]